MPITPDPQGDRIMVQSAYGREQRKAVPRGAHGAWTAAPDRSDPLALLRAQDADQQRDLVSIRWGRLSRSPFMFCRGSAALMASDLASAPRSGLDAQLCGDAHLSNFGLFNSPQHPLVFDLSDFDETLFGPFEWDLKRLAASVVLASRNNGFGEDVARSAALAAVRSYRQRMAAYAQMRELEMWHSRVATDDALKMVRASRPKVKSKNRAAARGKARAGRDAARGQSGPQAAAEMTELADGARRIVEQPPVIMHFEEANQPLEAHDLYKKYVTTLTSDRRTLARRFEVLDVAGRLVGADGLATRCFILLMSGRDQDDQLLLQAREAGRSVLEPYLGASRLRHAGHRVVAGQQLTQAADDIFLGWMTGPDGRYYYWRQLRDAHGSIAVENLKPRGLEHYAELCGWALARGHARSGQRHAISSYLGAGDRFDLAIADFAKSYADQAEKDHAALVAAIRLGKVAVETGV